VLDLNAAIPLWAGMGVGLAGITAGAAGAAYAAREKLATAANHMRLAVHYWAKSERVLDQASRLVAPLREAPRPQVTISLPVPQARDTVATSRWQRAQTLPDWAPGELTAAFNAIVAANDTPTQVLPTLRANPYVVPKAPAVPTASRPSYPARPSRAQWAPGPDSQRGTAWRVFELIGEIPVPELPRPFQMPGQRKPRPTPALLAKLPPDPMRAIRARIQAA
jgi:hypothetical protein